MAGNIDDALRHDGAGQENETYTSSRLSSARDTRRRTLGIVLLLIVVVLWTTSNFLASVRASLLPFPMRIKYYYTSTLWEVKSTFPLHNTFCCISSMSILAIWMTPNVNNL